MKELGHYGESFNASLQASDGDLSSYSFHMADQGTDAMEREKAFLFASQEGRYLWHVNQALRRLYQAPEKFGKCEQCGEEIGFERLRSEEHTSELQSLAYLVCRLLLEQKNPSRS